MKKVLMGVLIFVCILIFFFAVPPALTAKDTFTVLLGFLLLVVSLGGTLGLTVLLTKEISKE